MSKSPQCVWDVTIQMWNLEENQTEWSHLLENQKDQVERDVIALKKALREHTKKWAFQLEVAPTTRRLHLQLRFSLKLKQRLSGAKSVIPSNLAATAHLSPTSKEGSQNIFYVTKEDSRFWGPFLDTGMEMPRQLLPFTKQLLPWQDSMRSLLLHWDPRTIHVVVNESGNLGKSILMGLMVCRKEAVFVPLMSTYKDLMRAAMDQPKHGAYIVDIARAFQTGNELWAALETMKTGYVFDDRYTFKMEMIDSPGIVVFTNTMPPMSALSADRWAIWTIEDGQLKLIAGVFHDYFSEYVN